MEPSNKPATQPKKVDVLKNILNAPSVTEQFENALRENRGTFIASVIDLFNSDSRLQECDPKAVVMEALKAATLKLPINKGLGFAYIVPFNNSVKKDGQWVKVMTPTFMPGYKGYIQLAMRTGQYKIINADLVYEGELVRKDKLTGEYDLSGDRLSDKVIGYFCYFSLLNGFSKSIYMTTKEMATYAKRYSPSVKKETTIEQLEALANNDSAGKAIGWDGENFNSMGLKTVIRRLLSRYGYLSVEMIGALEKDIDENTSNNTRDEQVGELANSKTINITDVSFENVVPEGSIVDDNNQSTDQGPGF